MARHAHAAATLTIIVRGGFVERQGRGERDYVRGHVAFLPAGREHAQSFGHDGARQVTFEPTAEWIDYLADSRIALTDGPFANAAVFRRIGDQLASELCEPDSLSAVACEGLMMEAVAAFGRTDQEKTSPGAPPTWLIAARDFIEENVASPLSLATIAGEVGRHEIHLAREFRRHFGAPIGAYQRRLRIEHATVLLCDERRSLSEVALDCGFSSHSHFCREFKAQMGLTPSQYRRDV
jgi:AraC family transcriptional regulator